MKQYKPIYNTNEIQENDVILFIDKESKKIRGIDRILTINRNNLEYTYNGLTNPDDFSNPDKIFNGNLTKNINRYTTMLVDEDFAKQYSDKALHHAILSWDYSWVFELILPENMGAWAWDLVMNDVNNNIYARISFIDLTNKFEPILHKLIFDDTIHAVSEEELSGLRYSITQMKKREKEIVQLKNF